jgi:hypothetical protein
MGLSSQLLAGLRIPLFQPTQLIVSRERQRRITDMCRTNVPRRFSRRRQGAKIGKAGIFSSIARKLARLLKVDEFR